MRDKTIYDIFRTTVGAVIVAAAVSLDTMTNEFFASPKTKPALQKHFDSAQTF